MLVANGSRKPTFASLPLSVAAALMCLVFVCVSVAELLLPDAPGDVVYKKSGTVVDASHADQGYVVVSHKKSNKRLKLRVSLGRATMTYDLNSNGEAEVFPLQLGSGKYKLQVFSQVSGSKYSTASSISFKAEVADETMPFRYPNQYVNYNADSLAVKMAQELCAGVSTDSERFQAVYGYVTANMVYDYIRAVAVTSGEISGYLPNVDDVFTQKKGICFDFAAIMATMLRSQGVACRLVIGYADRAYHAWNEVYIDGQWVRCDVTSDVCATTVSRYTTERIY